MNEGPAETYFCDECDKPYRTLHGVTEHICKMHGGLAGVETGTERRRAEAIADAKDENLK